jgi:hypothetical protein
MPRKTNFLSSVAWAVVPPLVVVALLLVYYGLPSQPEGQAVGWSLAIIYGAYMVWAWGTGRNIQVAATTIQATGSSAARAVALLLGLAQIIVGAFMLIR